MIPNYSGFWVTGGITGGITSSTEIYTTAGTWTTGPVMPKALWGHCVTQIDNDNTLLVGGTEGIGVKKLIFFKSAEPFKSDHCLIDF
jgi:hypothetical protein